MATFCPAQVDLDGAILDPPEFPEPLREGGDPCPCRRCRTRPQEAYDRHRRLLSSRRERPRGSRAAEQPDELPPPHSITSSASSTNESGIVSPIALAALRLMINS